MNTKDKINEIIKDSAIGALILSIAIILFSIVECFGFNSGTGATTPTTFATSEPTAIPQILHTEAHMDIPTISPTSLASEMPSVTNEPTNAPTETPMVDKEVDTTVTTELTPTASPEPTPEWIILYATSYTDTYNKGQGRAPTGCKNDIPLEGHWSIASFLDDILPYGTIIQIDGLGVYEVCDTCDEGGAIWNQRQYDITEGKFSRAISWIDIYFENEEEAEAFGRMLVRAKIIKYGDGETYTTKSNYMEANK